MNTVARCFVMFCLVLATGCADMGIENPFATSSSTTPATGASTSSGGGEQGMAVSTPPPSEIFYDQFPDIPLPSDMTVKRERSLITSAQDGTRVGLITVEGRVDIASLNNAMIHNMARQGWALRAASSGVKNIQIYEKDARYVVIYTYEQMISTAMEVWVALRLGVGAYPGPASGGGSFAIDPGTSSGGGVTQRGLTN